MPTIFFDFDSTVCTKESLDEVIALALSEHPDQEKLVSKVEAITNQGMNGELDFKQSLEARFAVCPLHRSHFDAVGKKLTKQLTPGMKELFTWLQKNGWQTYIISGGFLPSVLPSALELGLDEQHVFTSGLRCNDQGAVEGVDHSSLLWTNLGKTPVIQHLANTQNLRPPLVLVGDGSNDLAAYQAGMVDHFVGFGANVVRDKIKTQSPQFVESTEALQAHLKQLL